MASTYGLDRRLARLDNNTAQPPCPDCGREVLRAPAAAMGFIAKCGRRLARLDQCSAGDVCPSRLTGSEQPEISSATFDILERMAKAHPELAGGYARATAGVDIDLVVAVFANALHDLTRDGDARIVSDAVGDVLAERRRQVEGEGWASWHDDRHTNQQMPRAAVCYILGNGGGWPWALAWWKPGTMRRNLVKAAALIIAEIERLDRAAR